MGNMKPTRRQFLKRAGVISVSVPVVGNTIPTMASSGQGKNIRAIEGKNFYISRNFNSDVVELIRILKEITEIEHSLMLQYLYAGFSVKPEFSSIVGNGAPDSTSLIGIAIQEMQHLGSINRLLVELDASPNLDSQDFPFEYEIYPFSMTLEPLSRASIAKYAYCESPDIEIGKSLPKNREDKLFWSVIDKELGDNLKINRVGSVYQILIDLFTEVTSSSHTNLDRDYWIDELRRIMDEGEQEHYRFFKSLLTGTNPVFRDKPDLWASEDKYNYPVYTGATNPTAYIGHPNTIADEELRNFAWLGNLYYWTALILLDQHYRYKDQDLRSIAILIMMGPLKGIGQLLAKNGSGMPFDRLSLGTNPCRSMQSNLDFCMNLLQEASKLSKSLKNSFPESYPESLDLVMKEQLKSKIIKFRNELPKDEKLSLIALSN